MCANNATENTHTSTTIMYTMPALHVPLNLLFTTQCLISHACVGRQTPPPRNHPPFMPWHTKAKKKSPWLVYVLENWTTIRIGPPKPYFYSLQCSALYIHVQYKLMKRWRFQSFPFQLNVNRTSLPSSRNKIERCMCFARATQHAGNELSLANKTWSTRQRTTVYIKWVLWITTLISDVCGKVALISLSEVTMTKHCFSEQLSRNTFEVNKWQQKTIPDPSQ